MKELSKSDQAVLLALALDIRGYSEEEMVNIMSTLLGIKPKSAGWGIWRSKGVDLDKLKPLLRRRSGD